MLGAASARWAALLQSRRTAQVAVALWSILAIVVWNAVFDRILERPTGSMCKPLWPRRTGPALTSRVDDWMWSVERRALWIASAAAGGVLAVGLITLGLARRQSRVTKS